jgi:MinD superfamily P-loop ATPase
VARLRREAHRLAESLDVGLVLIDGPPGIACPVHAAITGVDGVVVVTEPTQAGVHDLTRALDLVGHFRIPAGVIVNKADLNAQGAQLVGAVASRRRVPLLGHIPFDPRLPQALTHGQTGLEIPGTRESILACWDAAREALMKETYPESHVATLSENRL